MAGFGAALLAKESSVASATFALLTAGLSVAAFGVAGIIDAQSHVLASGFDAVLAHTQIYRLAWDASDMQFSVRSQQNERYYVSDPGNALSQDHIGWMTASLADCVKRVILEA
jgi:hypothetical protein